MADKITNLYNTFVDNGYDMEPEDEFRKNLERPEARKSAYDALVADGYDMEPYEEFEQNIGYSFPYPKAKELLDKGMANIAVPQKATPQAQMMQAEATYNSAKGAEKPLAGATPFNKEANANAMELMRGSIANFNEQTKQSNKQTKQTMQKQTKVGLESPFKPKAVGYDFDFENKKVRQKYVTPTGEETFEPFKADVMANADREHYYIAKSKERIDELKKRLANREKEVAEEDNGLAGIFTPDNEGLAPAYTDKKVDQDATYAELSKELEKEQEKHDQMVAESIDAQRVRDTVSTLGADIDKGLNEATGKAELEYAKNPHTWGVSSEDQAGIHAAAIRGNKDVATYSAAKTALTNAQQIIDEADATARGGGFFGSMGRAMRDKAFDLNTWDMGITDTGEGAALVAAVNAADDGKQLTNAQRALLDAKAIEMAATAYFGSRVSDGYQVGSITVQSIPFMIEMAINPASTIGNKAVNKLARYAIKRYGKNALRDHALKYGLAHLGARVGGDIAGATTMALTTGIGRVAADATRRMAGTVGFKPTKDGGYTYVKPTDSVGVVEAVAKAVGATAIENHSEMLGAYLAPIFGAAGKATAKVVDKALQRWTPEFGTRLANSFSADEAVQFMKRFSKTTRYDGQFGEYAEEVLGGIENALIVHDQTLDTDPDTGVFNAHNNAITFMGLLPTSIFFSTLSTGGYIYNRGKLALAKRQAEKLFKDDWQPMQAAFDSNNVAAIENQIILNLRNKSLTKEQRKAALDYLKAKQATDWSNKAISVAQQEVAEGRARVIQPQQITLGREFDRGRNLDLTTQGGLQEYANIASLYEQKRQQFIDEIGADALADFEADPISGILKSTLPVVAEYANARAAYQGVMLQESQRIESELTNKRQEITNYVNKDSGTIKATTYHHDDVDEQVYITSGNVVVSDDGSIDTANSDKTAIVYIPSKGKVEQVAVSALSGGVVDNNVQEFTNAALEQLGMQLANDAAMRRYGQPDDRAWLNEINTLGGGVDTPLSPEDSSEGDMEGNNSQPGQPTTQQQSEPQAPQQYAVNDRVAFTDGNGKSISGIVQEIDSDGVVISLDNPINGLYVIKIPQDALNSRLTEYNGKPITQPIPAQEPTQAPSQTQESEPTEVQPVVEQPKATPAEEQLADDAMPMTEDGEPDYMASTPERARTFIYDEVELSKTEANEHVAAQLSAANKALEKAKNAAQPKMGTSIKKYNEAKQARQQKIDAAQQAVDFWTAVQQEQFAIDQTERAAQAQKDAASVQQNGDVGGSNEGSGDKGENKPNKKETPEESGGISQIGDRDVLNKSLTANEAETIISLMENEATTAPLIELTPENWVKQFGEQGEVDTPLSTVKMGENQYFKIAQQGRNGKLGMIKPTLEHPFIIIEDRRPAKDGNQERETSYVFIRAFKNENGERVYYFTSVTIQKDSKEVVISNQEKSVNRISKLLQQGKVAWIDNNFSLHPITQIEESVPLNDSNKPTTTDNQPALLGVNSPENVPSSESKDTNNATQLQGNEEKSSENKAISSEPIVAAGTYFQNNEAGNGAVAKVIGRADDGTYLISFAPSLEDAQGGLFLGDQQFTEEELKSWLDEGKFSAIKSTRQDSPSTQQQVEAAAAETNTEPTPAQAEAGNYKKGKVTIGDFTISVEQPAGSIRRGPINEKTGKPEWETKMANTYGYILGTKGVDGDHIDIFLANDMDAWNGRKVFVVDQVNEDGSFDEHKCMLGFNELEDAEAAYYANYEANWKQTHPGIRVTGVNIEDFNKWVQSSKRKTKAFAEYSAVKEAVSKTGTATQADAPKPHELPKRLENAYAGGNEEEVVEEERAIRDFISGTKDYKAVFVTYFRAKENARGIRDKEDASRRVNEFIAQCCKDALKDAGFAPNVLYKEKARADYAATATDAAALDILSVDTSTDVVGAVVRNPHTQEETLQAIAERYGNNGLDFEAKQALERRKEAKAEQAEAEYSSVKNSGAIQFSFVDGVEEDEMHDMLSELSSWSNGSINLVEALEKHFGGQFVSASRGARHAIESGLVPVPDGKYSGENEEYHHIEFRNEDGETFVESVPFIKAEDVEEKYGIRYQIDETKPSTSVQRAMGEAIAGIIGNGGLKVHTSAEEFEKALLEGDAQYHAKLSALTKAALFIRDGLVKKKNNISFEISLPTHTRDMIRKVMKRDFDSHNIDINGVRHGLKNHGVGGKKLNKNSIPITDKDAELIPYIMTAPDYVRPGSDDFGRESIRFYKTLSNGYVVVVEKEQKNSPNDMDTINIWAELSSNVADAYSKKNYPGATPKNVTISMDDAAKIRKDAENAIAKDEISEKMTVWHGSPASFDTFDHSHMGEGEGAQVHGWGSYVAISKGIGKAYAQINEPSKFAEYKGDVEVPKSSPYAVERIGSLFLNRSKQEVEAFIEESIANENNKETKDIMSAELDFLRQTKEEDWVIDQGGRANLYEVEIPDDTGGNYIDEHKTYTWRQAKRIFKAVGIDADAVFVKGNDFSGREMYDAIAEELGGAEKASKALREAGFVGIKYDGLHDGPCYVIFNDKDLKIINRTQFFKTSRGEVYGFVKDGEIYLDPKLMNPNTPIHEYTHIWDKALQRANPELWERGKELMRGLPLWNEVKNNPAYADIADDEDLLASEVHSRLAGTEGEKILREQLDKLNDDAKNIIEKAEAYSLIDQVKQWLADAIKAVRDAFGRWSDKDLQSLTWQEFAKMPLRDLAQGANMKNLQQKAEQTAIVRENNPAEDDYHTWIRSASDIKTFDEMLAEAERDYEDYGDMTYPDMTIEDLREAKESGYITVYSSKPIKQGIFVTPSHMNANEYAGGGKVYSKRVPVSSVAWIGQDEGQYAETGNQSAGGKVQMMFVPVEESETSKITRAFQEENAGACKKVIVADTEGVLRSELIENGVGETEREEYIAMYKKGNPVALYIPWHDLVIIFDSKAPKAEINKYLWHENTHMAWEKLFGKQKDKVISRIYESFLNSEVSQDFATTRELFPEESESYIREECVTALCEELYSMPSNEVLSIINELTKIGYNTDGVFEQIYKYIKYGEKDKREQTPSEVLGKNAQQKALELRNSEATGGARTQRETSSTAETEGIARGERLREVAVFSEGEILPVNYREVKPAGERIVKDYSTGESRSYPTRSEGKYSIEGLPGEYNSLGELAGAFYAKYPEYVAIPTEDGKGLEIMSYDAVMERGGDMAAVMDRARPHYDLANTGNNVGKRKRAAETMRRRMIAQLEETAKRLGLELEILTSTKGLEGRMAKAKGWYSIADGKITIVLPNNVNAADVMRTLLHEGVAHHGLRELFGEDFDAFLDNAYANAVGTIRVRIQSLAEKNGGDLREATEEYLASLAEDENFKEVRNTSWWGKVKRYITDMLRSAGVKFGFKLTDNDFRYALWESYENLKRKGGVKNFLDEAQSVVKRAELKPSEVDAMVENAGRTPQQREAGAVTDAEIEALNNSMKSSDPEAIQSSAQKVADELHTPVRFITDVNEITHPDPKKQTKMRKAKGWRDNVTGEIVVVVPNNTDTMDAIATVFHEVVGHKGLRELVGDENYYNFCMEVYHHAKADVRAKIAAKAAKHGWDFAKATDEYLAELAERGFEDFSSSERSLWGWLKDKVLDILDRFLETMSLPRSVKLGDNELRYLLWRSHENLRRGRENPIELAADYVKRAELELTDMRESEDIEAINNAFNERLLSLSANPNQKDRSLHLGKSSSFLRAGGVADAEIMLEYDKFARKSKSNYKNNHPFEAEDILDLPKVLQEPIAVFNSTNGKDKVILTELKKDGKNFVVAIKTVEQQRKGGVVLEVNEIETLYPKMEKGVIGWFNKGLATIINKEKALNWVEALPTNPGTTTDNQELMDTAKVIENFENPNKIDDISFRDGDPEIMQKARVRDLYERRMKSGLYQAKEALQDSMASLKEAMKYMLGKDATLEDVENVAGFENAYTSENALSSINQEEVNAFSRLVMRPLMKAVAKLAKDEHERVELINYMMAKHGLERNEYMARRDAEKKFEDSRNAVFEALDELEHVTFAGDPSGFMNSPARTQLLQQLDGIDMDIEDAYQENRKRDYSGLTALTGKGSKNDVADAEIAAQQMVSDYETNNDTKELWDRVKAVNDATLLKTYECGLLTEENYNLIKEMYQYYIPLRGFDETTSNEAYAYLGTNDAAFNAPIKEAFGRASKADDPIANMQNMAESAIMQGNRNKLVKQRFYNFVLNHPSDLVSIRKMWLQYNDVENIWEPVMPNNLNPDDTPEEIEQKWADFEQRMAELKEQEPKKYKYGEEAENIPYRVVNDKEKFQHQIIVKRGGKTVVLTVNGNPRLAQAINGLTNPDSPLKNWWGGATLNRIANANRYLSAVYTTLQPDFIASNFMRDLIYANSMVWIKERPAYAFNFNVNYNRLPITRMKILFAKHRNGKLNMNNEIERLFAEYMANGGETGYARMANVEKIKRGIQTSVKSLNATIKVREGSKWLGEWVGEVGRGIESRARFAAYVTSRHDGRDIQKSIWDAKEISVNFNKKGAGDTFLGANGQTWLGNTSTFASGVGRAGYIFWNAAMQGTWGNFGKNAMRHPYKTLGATATMFCLALLITALAGSAGDDDDKISYYDLPEYTRRSNICIKGPGDSWFKIPLPIEFRAIYGLGEMCGSAIFHGEKIELDKLLGMMTQVLPVDMMAGQREDDFSLLAPLVPSALKPLYDVSNNRSFTGLPIWKDTPYNQYMPGWTKAYKNANQQLVGLSEWLNEVTGGNGRKKKWGDFNPAAVEYVLRGYLGGFWTIPDQLIKSAETMFGDREFEWRNVPLANRVVTNGDERTEHKAINTEFFRKMKEHKEMSDIFHGYIKDTENGVRDYSEEIHNFTNSPEFDDYQIIKEYNKELKKIRQGLESMLIDDERRKVLETAEFMLKKDMLQKLDSLKTEREIDAKQINR